MHSLMSAQDDESDLARINRLGHRQPVKVHRWTFAVLRLARAISEASEGAFDVTLGRLGATYKDVHLLPGLLVRLRKPAKLDLGGIAKGYAVDRAARVLRALGAKSGCVNAGGDLRLFGPAAQEVHVRLPRSPERCIRLASARDAAFATSAGYYLAEVLDPRTQRRLCLDSSVSVVARSCVIADALTKAVAAIGPRPELLGRFGAKAYLLDATGALHASRC